MKERLKKQIPNIKQGEKENIENIEYGGKKRVEEDTQRENEERENALISK